MSVLVDIGVADGVEPRVVSLARQEVPGGAPRAGNRLKHAAAAERALQCRRECQGVLASV